MRRLFIPALYLSMFLLSSCTGSSSTNKERILEIRTKYIAASSIQLTANMVADYGDRVYSYKLNYIGDGARGEISVSEPDNITGLRALIDGNDIILKYEGAILDTGSIISAGLSPIEAFALMINAWRNGYISAVYSEKLDQIDALALVIDLTPAGSTDKTLHRVWFDEHSGLPLRAEIEVSGYTAISCVFSQAAIT